MFIWLMHFRLFEKSLSSGETEMSSPLVLLLASQRSIFLKFNIKIINHILKIINIIFYRFKYRGPRMNLGTIGVSLGRIIVSFLIILFISNSKGYSLRPPAPLVRLFCSIFKLISIKH